LDGFFLNQDNFQSQEGMSVFDAFDQFILPQEEPIYSSQNSFSNFGNQEDQQFSSGENLFSNFGNQEDRQFSSGENLFSNFGNQEDRQFSFGENLFLNIDSHEQANGDLSSTFTASFGALKDTGAYEQWKDGITQEEINKGNFREVIDDAADFIGLNRVKVAQGTESHYSKFLFWDWISIGMDQEYNDMRRLGQDSPTFTAYHELTHAFQIRDGMANKMNETQMEMGADYGAAFIGRLMGVDHRDEISKIREFDNASHYPYGSMAVINANRGYEDAGKYVNMDLTPEERYDIIKDALENQFQQTQGITPQNYQDYDWFSSYGEENARSWFNTSFDEFAAGFGGVGGLQ
jgi:hypothetical protein